MALEEIFFLIMLYNEALFRDKQHQISWGDNYNRFYILSSFDCIDWRPPIFVKFIIVINRNIQCLWNTLNKKTYIIVYLLT